MRVHLLVLLQNKSQISPCDNCHAIIWSNICPTTITIYFTSRNWHGWLPACMRQRCHCNSFFFNIELCPSWTCLWVWLFIWRRYLFVTLSGLFDWMSSRLLLSLWPLRKKYQLMWSALPQTSHQVILFGNKLTSLWVKYFGTTWCYAMQHNMMQSEETICNAIQWMQCLKGEPYKQSNPYIP